MATTRAHVIPFWFEGDIFGDFFVREPVVRRGRTDMPIGAGRPRREAAAVPPYGACCFDDGGCSLMTESGCASWDGHYHGDGTRCLHAACDMPYAHEDTGGCMRSPPINEGSSSSAACPGNFQEGFDSSSSRHGRCVRISELGCGDVGGRYLGDEVVCPPRGSCAMPNGDCTYVEEEVCNDFCGAWSGALNRCSPTGACCIGDGCYDVTEARCLLLGGIFQGEWTSCKGDACYDPPIQGACNLPEGTCVITGQAQCTEVFEGEYQGDDTTCIVGACEYDDGCVEGVHQAYCESLPGGVYQGDGTACGGGARSGFAPVEECGVGACTPLSGPCFYETEANCSGVYGGDGSLCPRYGACCENVGTPGAPSFNCSNKTRRECRAAYGFYQGDDTACAGVNDCERIDLPMGACKASSSADDYCWRTSSAGCAVAQVGGDWTSEEDIGGTCGPRGACTHATLPNGCKVMPETTCASHSGCAGGACYGGDGSWCAIRGACCLPNGTCVEHTAASCASAGGKFKGGIGCHDGICPLTPGTGACHIPGYGCRQMGHAECLQLGGTGWEACKLCPPRGACCGGTQNNKDVTLEDCLAGGGEYFGNGTMVLPPKPNLYSLLRNAISFERTYGVNGRIIHDVHAAVIPTLHYPVPPCDVDAGREARPDWPAQADPLIDKAHFFREPEAGPLRMRSADGYSQAELDYMVAEGLVAASEDRVLRVPLYRGYRDKCGVLRFRADEARACQLASPPTDLMAGIRGRLVGPPNLSNTPTTYPWFVTLKLPLVIYAKRHYFPAGGRVTFYGRYKLVLRYSSRIWNLTEGGYLNIPMILDNSTHTHQNSPFDEPVYVPGIRTRWHVDAYPRDGTPYQPYHPDAAIPFPKIKVYWDHNANQNEHRISIAWSNSHLPGDTTIPVIFAPNQGFISSRYQSDIVNTYHGWLKTGRDFVAVNGTPWHYTSPSNNNWPWAQPSLDCVSPCDFDLFWDRGQHLVMGEGGHVFAPEDGQPNLKIGQLAIVPGWLRAYSAIIANAIYNAEPVDDQSPVGLRGGGYLNMISGAEVNEHSFFIQDIVPRSRARHIADTNPNGGNPLSLQDCNDAHVYDALSSIGYVAYPDDEET